MNLRVYPNLMEANMSKGRAIIITVLALAALVVLGACSKFEDPTGPQRRSNVVDTTQITCVRILANDTTCVRIRRVGL